MILSDTSEERVLALVLHNSLSQLYKSPSMRPTVHSSPSSPGVRLSVCVSEGEGGKKNAYGRRVTHRREAAGKVNERA